MGGKKIKKKILFAAAMKKAASQKESPRKKSIKITGLNDKCLKKIGAYLEIDDLANMAASCNRFNPICTELFKEQYEKLRYPIRVHDIYDEDKFKRYESLIINFGKHIKRLRVDFDSADNRDNRKMHDLIGEHCSGTLIELHYVAMDKRMGIYRTYPRLTHLTLTHCHMSVSVSHFDKWCPNLRSLNLEMVQSVINTACIERPLPKLEHFGLINFINCNFSQKNVRRSMKSNPQLKSLRLCRDIFGMALKITTEYISYIDQMLPNLETLDILYTHRSAPPACAHLYKNPPKFNNLKCLQMTCRSADTLSTFKIPNQTIEKLSVDIEQGANDANFDYIMDSKQLKSLIWFINKENDLKYIFKLSQNPLPLPGLSDLQLYVVYGLNKKSHNRCQVLISIIDFMVQHKQLKTIVVAFQMTENNKKFRLEEVECRENCSKLFGTKEESSNDDAEDDNDNDDNDDDDDDEDDIYEEASTLLNNVAGLGDILHPFSNIVQHKFNSAWKITFYTEKKPNKLMPVVEDVFVCVAFKKNPIN